MPEYTDDMASEDALILKAIESDVRGARDILRSAHHRLVGTREGIGSSALRDDLLACKNHIDSMITARFPGGVPLRYGALDTGMVNADGYVFFKGSWEHPEAYKRKQERYPGSYPDPYPAPSAPEDAPDA